MLDITQKDILLPGEVLPGSAGSMPGGDFIGQLNKLAAEANKFMDGLKLLSEKSGLPLIGDDAAIRRLAVPTAPEPKYQLAPPPRTTPPPPGVAAAPAAMPAVDWPAVLDKIDNEIKKLGLGGVTIGMIFEVYKDKSLADLMNEIKGSSKNGNKT
ncbi:MAG: hypothetical protein ACRKGH_01685 [Dehalogenimonas sp.]